MQKLHNIYVRGFEMPIQNKKNKYYFKEVGRNTKETVEFIEKFYSELFEIREGATFEDLLNDANNPSYFRKTLMEE